MTTRYIKLSLITSILLVGLVVGNMIMEKASVLDIIILCFGLVVCIANLFIFYSTIKPFKAFSAKISGIKEGNLTSEVPYKAQNELGKIADAINSNLNNLRELLNMFRNQAEELSTKSIGIAAATDSASRAVGSITRTVTELAQGAQEAGEMAQDASNKTEKVSELAKNTSEKMKTLFENTNRMLEAAQKGCQAIKESTNVISQIAAMADNNVYLGGELRDKSQKVRDIVEIINSIAAQTNLLALNAAVEAARAGEHGRGFAVVADEVRLLSEQSSSAAAQINEIVESMLTDIAKVVDTFESTKESINSGVTSVANANTNFGDITSEIEKTQVEANEVAQLANHQAKAAVNLMNTVHGVAAIAEQSAAAAQTVAANSQQVNSSIGTIVGGTQALSGLAGNLEQAIFRFKFSNTKTLRVALNLSDNSTLYAGMEGFATALRDKTQGRYDLKIFHSSQLGDESQLMKRLQDSTLEMACISSSPLAAYDKRFMLFDFPFVFKNEMVADYVLQSSFGRKMLDLLKQHGFYGLTFAENGFRDMTNSRNTIRKVEDFKSLKIRTMQNPLHIDTWKALGTLPVALPFAQVYDALLAKEVDGQENPLSIIHSSSLYEVQKYLTLTHHVYTPFVLMYSDHLWETLSEEDQKLITAAAEQGAKITAEINRQKKDEFLLDLKEKGMVVEKIEPSEMSRIKTIVQPVIAQYTQDIGVELVQEFFETIRQAEAK